MQTIFGLCVQIVATVLAADFAAGFIHWIEDAYVREDTPVFGRFMARANIIHHHYPRYFTQLNWWQSSWDLVCISAVVVIAAWGFDLLTWHVWLFAALSANANQVHKWAHRTRKENGQLISFLQDIRLLQTPHHHAVHHTNPKNVHYCTTTNLLNPLLDGIRFWNGLEWLILRVFHIQRREDTSLPGHGPEPDWMKELREKPCQRGKPIAILKPRFPRPATVS